MDKEYIKEKLTSIMSQNGLCLLNEEELLEIDSVQFITIILDIEEAFQIEIPDDKLIIDELKSLDDFCNLIYSLLNQ
ncbi:MAG: acyl carrier protein [Clostridiales bacterium]|nr:acyl carrier protein [Clostridiales bacterium]